MGPIVKYFRLVAVLLGGAIVLIVAALNTPRSYVLIPIAALIFWFAIIIFMLSDIRCVCGWRIEDGMSWAKGWPKRQCPACGRDLAES
jgi:hypothetical protein